jgi:hypothetical protein
MPFPAKRSVEESDMPQLIVKHKNPNQSLRSDIEGIATHYQGFFWVKSAEVT